MARRSCVDSQLEGMAMARVPDHILEGISREEASKVLDKAARYVG